MSAMQHINFFFLPGDCGQRVQLIQLLAKICLARSTILIFLLNSYNVFSYLNFLSILDQSTGPKYLTECLP